jgi:hypothetical protein
LNEAVTLRAIKPLNSALFFHDHSFHIEQVLPAFRISGAQNDAVRQTTNPGSVTFQGQADGSPAQKTTEPGFECLRRPLDCTSTLFLTTETKVSSK